MCVCVCVCMCARVYIYRYKCVCVHFLALGRTRTGTHPMDLRRLSAAWPRSSWLASGPCKHRKPRARQTQKDSPRDKATQRTFLPARRRADTGTSSESLRALGSSCGALGAASTTMAGGVSTGSGGGLGTSTLAAGGGSSASGGGGAAGLSLAGFGLGTYLGGLAVLCACERLIS